MSSPACTPKRPPVTSHLRLISASQINTFRSCERAWGFGYIEGIRTPQHPAAALGTEVDDEQLQPFLRDGKTFDYARPSGSGYIAAALLGYLPPTLAEAPGSGLQVQKHFLMPGIDPVTHAPAGWGFQGYMDLWLPSSHEVPGAPNRLYGASGGFSIGPDQRRQGVPFVGDFKTTGDLKWAKGEDSLSVDPQAMIYAMAAMYETGSRVVDLAWMYAQTKGAKKSKRTFIRVTADHVVEQFSQINQTAQRLYQLRKDAPNPLTLEPSPAHCGAYGGCPFRDRCNLSPLQLLSAAETNTTTNALAFLAQGEPSMNTPTTNLLAALAARKAGTAAAPALLTPATKLVEALAQPGTFRVDAPVVVAPAPTFEPPAALPEWATAAVDPIKVGKVRPTLGAPVAINPPESALPPAPATGVPLPVPVPQAAEPVVVAPPKRGRPRKVAAPEAPPAQAVPENIAELEAIAEQPVLSVPSCKSPCSSGLSLSPAQLCDLADKIVEALGARLTLGGLRK